MKLLVKQNIRAPSSVRNVPDTFCFTFAIRISRSASLLSNGISACVRKPKMASLFRENRSHKFFEGDCLERFWDVLYSV